MKTEIANNNLSSFKTPEISDIYWYKNILKKENSNNCDYCFGNVFMWRHGFVRGITQFEDGVISKFSYNEKPFYSFPIGCSNIKNAIEFLLEDSKNSDAKLQLLGLSKKHVELLEKNFPNQFLFSETRDYEDYLYDINKLATYSGKKLHSKKNHCNKFESEYDWTAEPITKEKINDCLDMLNLWIDENKSRLSDDIYLEKAAIQDGFKYFEELSLFGYILKISDKIVAFSVGEKISEDTCDIHFEKAYTSYDGAYSMICREFAKYIKEIHPEIKFLNREDDMGNLSLRQSKESYHPDCMVQKFMARYKYDK